MSAVKEPKQKLFKLPNRVTWVKAKLRNASIQWPAKTEAFRRVRIERGLYKCQECNTVMERRKLQADHREPVVAIEKGWTNFDDYINRLFCDVEGYNILCETCHENKTTLENSLRTHYKKLAKKKK